LLQIIFAPFKRATYSEEWEVDFVLFSPFIYFAVSMHFVPNRRVERRALVLLII